ncbi:S-protein homolog 74-like [Cucumis sativus]|uniref:S-protein homolog 74-like n=1 Tax=Cucumis sativus TaxID=3659 RepID=UPI0005ED400F|nr:S-protein homolog 74-like [Cucumis sativus]
MKNVVILWLVTAALVGGQVLRWSEPPPKRMRYHVHVLNGPYYVHVLNGLNHHSLDVHCQSKDNDLGHHYLVKHGDDFQWNFIENLWRTTLFWCRLEKSDAYVSFESFWPESLKNPWLRHRCGTQLTCLWTAKDDGIYLRNMPTNADEFVHKWIPK